MRSYIKICILKYFCDLTGILKTLPYCVQHSSSLSVHVSLVTVMMTVSVVSIYKCSDV